MTDIAAEGRSDSEQGLRRWLADVEESGELREVRGANWDLEIGTISALNYRRKPPFALLFDDIEGYPSGFRVLTGSVSNARRLGRTLRLGDDLDDYELVEQLRGKPNEWNAAAADFAPEVVESGPVTENVIEGADVDLTKFPAPKWHEHDGGRYLGTGCMVITSDPETGVTNGGSYRVQIQEEGKTATVNVGIGKHGHLNLDRWFARDGRAPIVIVLGADPVTLVTAGTEVPRGISELNYAGAVMGKPLQVITSERTGLPIPAAAEIVIEGWLSPDRRLHEGPFGEWTGYYSGSDRPVYAIDIDRVLHRDNPIILGAPPGLPPHDYSYMRTVMKSAMILDNLQSSGVAGVKNAWAHEAGGGRLLIAVSLKQAYAGHSRQVGYLTAQGAASAYMNRYVITVDDDIDVRSLDDVMWAVCTRSDPAEDIEIMRKSWGSTADPLLTDHKAPYNSRAFIDACRPFERRDAFPRVAQPSPELIKATIAKWRPLLGDVL
jgi:UbiD family decarboxylase